MVSSYKMFVVLYVFKLVLPVFINHVVICCHCHFYVNMLNVSCVLMDHMVFCIQNKLMHITYSAAELRLCFSICKRQISS